MAVCGGLCPEPLLLAELSLDNIDTVSENALSLSGLSVRIPAQKSTTKMSHIKYEKKTLSQIIYDINITIHVLCNKNYFNFLKFFIHICTFI